MVNSISLQSGSALVRCLVSARLWLAGECETLSALTGFRVRRRAALLAVSGGCLTGLALSPAPLGPSAWCAAFSLGLLLQAAGLCEIISDERRCGKWQM